MVPSDADARDLEIWFFFGSFSRLVEFGDVYTRQLRIDACARNYFRIIPASWTVSNVRSNSFRQESTLFAMLPRVGTTLVAVRWCIHIAARHHRDCNRVPRLPD